LGASSEPGGSPATIAPSPRRPEKSRFFLRQHPRGYHAGADSGYRDRSHEPLRHRPGKREFKVFEDKKEQEISQFSSEDAPLSAGVIFDCSGSMGHKLEKSRLAVSEFFKTANPETSSS